MTQLRIFDDTHPTTTPDEIAAALQRHGVWFDRWPERSGDPLDAYADVIDALKAQRGFTTADVVRLQPDHPDRDALRARFLQEHTHTEDEVRIFAEGSGVFFLVLGDVVHRLSCEAGDAVSIPAGTPHWFDAGPAPSFTAIRLFTDPSGWVAQYTGRDTAQHYPWQDV